MNIMNTMNTMNKNYIICDNYKIFVFDLDSTLFLYGNNSIYNDLYHKHIKVFLHKLKNRNKIICLATHNKKPFFILNSMEIKDVFDKIIYEKKNVNSIDNTIYEYTNKKDMLDEIMKEYNTEAKDIIFFDDHHYNISQVESLGIKSIHVSSILGIDFDNIYEKFYDKFTMPVTLELKIPTVEPPKIEPPKIEPTKVIKKRKYKYKKKTKENIKRKHKKKT